MGSVPGTSLISISSPNPRLGGTLLVRSVGNTSLYSINKVFTSPLYCSSWVNSYVTHPLAIPSSAYKLSFKNSKGISSVVPNGLVSPAFVLPISSAITYLDNILCMYEAISLFAIQNFTSTHKVFL